MAGPCNTVAGGGGMVAGEGTGVVDGMLGGGDVDHTGGEITTGCGGRTGGGGGEGVVRRVSPGSIACSGAATPVEARARGPSGGNEITAGGGEAATCPPGRRSARAGAAGNGRVNTPTHL